MGLQKHSILEAQEHILSQQDLDIEQVLQPITELHYISPITVDEETILQYKSTKASSENDKLFR